MKIRNAGWWNKSSPLLHQQPSSNPSLLPKNNNNIYKTQSIYLLDEIIQKREVILFLIIIIFDLSFPCLILTKDRLANKMSPQKYQYHRQQLTLWHVTTPKRPPTQKNTPQFTHTLNPSSFIIIGYLNHLPPFLGQTWLFFEFHQSTPPVWGSALARSAWRLWNGFTKFISLYLRFEGDRRGKEMRLGWRDGKEKKKR